MPDKEPAEYAGVRRLNKKPLLIVGIGLIFIVAVVIQAIAQRSQAQKAAANPARPAERNAVIDSKSSVESLTKDAPRGLIPEQEAAPKTVAPPLPQGELGQRQNEGVLAKEQVTEISIIPQNGLVNKAKSDEAAEERRRIRQAKRQAYEAALNSPTTVNSAQVDTASEQNRTKPFTAPQNVALSAMTDALSSRVASLGSGAASGLGPLGAAVAAAGESDPNGQKSKTEFFKNEQTGKYGYLIDTRQAALSPYEAKAGTVIPAVLVSGVNSDLPGMIIAQVSQDVYDTASGRHLLIPQGTKLLGSYDSMVTFGQNRAAVIWNKLTFPDASTLFLGSMPGADQAGYSGFKDKVNHHYMRSFGSALLVSVFGAGIQLSQPNSSGNLRPTAQEELAAEAGRQMGQLGMEIARKNLNTQPTIEVRPGYRFMVMINKDLMLQPYAPKAPRLQPR